MIATSAFSMGIDVPDIELLVHFNTPLSMTDYIQQIGRTGRDGRKAHGWPGKSSVGVVVMR